MANDNWNHLHDRNYKQKKAFFETIDASTADRLDSKYERLVLVAEKYFGLHLNDTVEESGIYILPEPLPKLKKNDLEQVIRIANRLFGIGITLVARKNCELWVEFEL